MPIASLVVKSADGNHIGHVNSLTDNDIATIKTMLSDVATISNEVATLDSQIVISTDDPSEAGTAGQLWFKYEA